MRFRSSWLLLLGLVLAGCQVEQPPTPESSTTDSEKKESSTLGSSSEGGTEEKSGERKSVAFVTNQIADFWKIAEAGCVAASKEFDIDFLPN